MNIVNDVIEELGRDIRREVWTPLSNEVFDAIGINIWDRTHFLLWEKITIESSLQGGVGNRIKSYEY